MPLENVEARTGTDLLTSYPLLCFNLSVEHIAQVNALFGRTLTEDALEANLRLSWSAKLAGEDTNRETSWQKFV